ncbi:MAG: HNH endonuclease [Planctomycetes bacterium]|nr:HNH endonuclease [Planctomycetota bacterium]
MATQRRAWSRDELLAAFNVYCRTPFGRLHRGNPDIVALADRLGRTPSSVAMKLCNFASLDPVHQARHVAGLRNASVADRAVFDEFEADWEARAIESEAALRRLGLRAAVPEAEESLAELRARAGDTEAIRTTRMRRAQSFFRATVLASYDFTCAVSGINIPALVQASHIIPWAREESRRVDPRNGIALSTLHDRAFDRGFITFDEDLRVIVSGRLRVGRPSEIHRTALLAIEGKKLRLPTRYAPDPTALAWHREHIFAA